MPGEEVPKDNQAWIKNFNATASKLVREQLKLGFHIQGIVMTENLYFQLSDCLGYPPRDLLGYVIEVLQQSEEEAEQEGDMLYLKGHLLN